MNEPREIHVLNLGAGVQSTTLYLMFMQGMVFHPKVGEDATLPIKLDYAVFADTGDEPVAVYKHLTWLQSLGGPEILVRSKGRLSDDLRRGENSSGQRFAAIPAYTIMAGDEEEGRTRRQCSSEYKINVIEKVIRREIVGLEPKKRIPKNVTVTQYVGISLDEAGRFVRVKKRRTLGGMRAPLIESFMTRANCLTWLKEFGKVPHEVPRSACVYCPFHDDEEWLRIKSVPEDWALAVEIDEALRKKGNIVNRNMEASMFVHRSCKPLVEIEFKPKDKTDNQTSMPFWRECLGVCGV